jgi:hypothetical protein
MVSGIASLGKGGSRATLIWASHVVGSLLGGAISALGFWLICTPMRTLLPAASVPLLFAASCIAAILFDLHVLESPIRRGQVPSKWVVEHGPMAGYLLYGVFLGSGFLTSVIVGLTFVVFIAAGLVMPLSGALIVGSLFALGRSFAVGVIVPLREDIFERGVMRLGHVQLRLSFISAAASGFLIVVAYLTI